MMHAFSLGKHHEVCERCLITVRENKGVSGDCTGMTLTDRERELVKAAMNRGFARGCGEASNCVRRLFEEIRRETGSTSMSLYKLMQNIGDLVGF
jgi:hypothetical protein